METAMVVYRSINNEARLSQNTIGELCNIKTDLKLPCKNFQLSEMLFL